MLHQRASANAIINKIMSNAKGIGESKSRAKQESNIKGQNGQNISSKAHSISSTQNLRTVTKQYINFVKENYKGKPISNINNESVKEFINQKIEDNLTLSSINTYISELGKMSDNLNQLGVDATSRESITAYRTDLKEQYGSLQSPKVDRTNSNPAAIIKEMKNTPYSLSSELQLRAGLRVDDALNLNKVTINQDNTLTVMGSKNGLNYTTATLNENLIQRVAEAQQNGYSVNYSEYREVLKEATEATNQEWKGTHSLRYDYANNQHQKNKENGMSESESKAQISLDMGHSRMEITEHYLK